MNTPSFWSKTASRVALIGSLSATPLMSQGCETGDQFEVRCVTSTNTAPLHKVSLNVNQHVQSTLQAMDKILTNPDAVSGTAMIDYDWGATLSRNIVQSGSSFVECHTEDEDVMVCGTGTLAPTSKGYIAGSYVEVNADSEHALLYPQNSKPALTLSYDSEAHCQAFDGQHWGTPCDTDDVQICTDSIGDIHVATKAVFDAFMQKIEK